MEMPFEARFIYFVYREIFFQESPGVEICGRQFSVEVV